MVIQYFVSYICYANKDIFVTVSLWRCNYMYCSCVVCSYYIRIIRVHTSRTYRLYCVLYNVRVLLNLYSLARISGSEQCILVRYTINIQIIRYINLYVGLVSIFFSSCRCCHRGHRHTVHRACPPPPVCLKFADGPPQFKKFADGPIHLSPYAHVMLQTSLKLSKNCMKLHLTFSIIYYYIF